MPVKEIGDPRLQALFGANDPRDGGVWPTVRLPGKGIPPIALGVVAVALGLILFLVLSSRRTQQVEPSVATRAADRGDETWIAPPPLYVPPVQQPSYVAVEPDTSRQPQPVVVQPLSSPGAMVRPTTTIVQPVPQVVTLPAPALPPPQQRTSAGSPLVIDTGNGSSASTTPAGEAGAGAQTVSRMRASSLANRSMTVPQGYLITAVLETAFDSTKPGFARAIVSRDVRGFDGKNVLIPRGSRLIGDYKSAVAQGQNRATISWTRLIRPDGMTIGMDAPAVDTVGRGGIPASVNTHFFSRLGDALLQSTFQIGQAFAGRSVTGPVVVLSSNAANAASQAMTPAVNYVPTLTVAPGKSISIFVAQDLDFTAAGAAR